MSGLKESNKAEPGLLKKAFGRWFGLFLVLASALLFYLVIVNLDSIFGYILYVAGIIKPVIYGAVIAYILNPLMKIYQRMFTAIYASRYLRRKKAWLTESQLHLHLLQGFL